MTDHPKGAPEPDAQTSHLMRTPCVRCENKYGRIERRATQGCVYRLGCGRFCYNAPRAETGNPVAHVGSRHNISPSQRHRILGLDNYRCVFCGAGADKAEMHIGHLVSVEEYQSLGLTERELQADTNLATSCAECNLGLGKQSVSPQYISDILRRRESATR